MVTVALLSCILIIFAFLGAFAEQVCKFYIFFPFFLLLNVILPRGRIALCTELSEWTLDVTVIGPGPILQRQAFNFMLFYQCESKVTPL